PQAYTILEITQVLELQGNGEKYAEYIVAKHISNFISYFCNSDKKRVKDLNYLDVVHDKKMKSFVKSYYKYIESNTRLLLGKMDEGEIEITHDFYLKKFQLSEPKLNFDTILFDEGQDASGAMLDIFIKQKAVKVIVGDTHQQIYGWRFAVNSLEKTKFKNFQLSMSFRFSQDIANLAIEILNWKKYLGRHKTVSIKGQGISKQDKTKAILARTNLGLLLKAIDLIVEKQKVKKIYFEGNIHSYTYADEGASLYDVLNLYNGKVGLIRDKLLKKMKDMSNLEDYIKQSDDVQLGMMVDIVKKYGNRLPGIIQSIKDKHVDREKAEIIFSTVHRSKGMEYDSVEIVNDFISEEKLEKL
ncbi:MAG: UvrD-helicase domain-containing protein, partial [Candidatus Marinimicrobia bacterium]|nr:UvrD-helicase domain-containing protein [Candidatus Neomarinimicrobiota bacterium]